MPTFRLTRNAATKSVDKHFDYIENNEQNEKLDDKTIISSKYALIMTKMKNNAEFLLASKMADRSKDVKNALISGNENELKEADENFHNDYDEMLSDYASDLLVMIDSIQNLKGQDIDTERYEKYFNNAKNTFVEFFNVDSDTFDEFIDRFSNCTSSVSIELSPFYKELDNEPLDDISDIEEEYEEEIEAKKEENRKLKIEEEKRKIDEAIEAKHQQELEQIRKADEKRLEQSQKEIGYYNDIEKANKFLYANFDTNSLKESERFVNNNFRRFENSNSYVEDTLQQIKNYNAIDKDLKNRIKNNPDSFDKLRLEVLEAENLRDEKKAYLGGYLKIKEHFDNKNIFQKLFSLRESIQEYRAIKNLKNEIHEKYDIDTGELDRLPEMYIKDKKSNKENNIEINNIENQRVHSNELENDLKNSLNTSMNNEKSISNTNDLSKNKDKSLE